MTFNWLDGFIAIILVINLLYGLRRGLIRSLSGIFALIIALFLCIKGTPAVAEVLLWLRLSGTWAYVTALVLLFIFIYFLVSEIGRHIQALTKESSFHHFDKLGGSLCGLVKGVLYTLFLIIPLLGNIFASPALLKAFEESTFLNVGRPVVYYAEPVIQDLIYQGNLTWQQYRKDFERYNTAIDPVREQEPLEEISRIISYY